MIREMLDIINATFEAFGGIFVWLNVRKLWKDWEIKGVDWKVSLFFTLWGLFNLILYPQLSMNWSMMFAVGLSLGNLTWTVMAINVVTSARRLKFSADRRPNGVMSWWKTGLRQVRTSLIRLIAKKSKA